MEKEENTHISALDNLTVKLFIIFLKAIDYYSSSLLLSFLLHLLSFFQSLISLIIL